MEPRRTDSPGTPPLSKEFELNSNKRSRSPTRTEKHKKRRRSSTRASVPRRYIKRHVTYRSRSRRSSSRSSHRRRPHTRSRRRMSSQSSNASSSSSSSHIKRRHSRNYRRSSASTSASSTGSNHTDLSSEIDTSERSSRNRFRENSGKRKRRRSRIRSNKQRRRNSSSDDFFTKFSRLLNRKGSSFDGGQNVIPEFDPDANSQTASDWLRKVNQTATIYGWNDKQIIYYAIPKLSGYAKKWYQGRSSVDMSWKQWQRKILSTFPDDRNYADKLYEMLERKSKREESLEEYFHDKARLAKMCGIKGRNAVDCIINGIFDNNIRLNAQGSSFKRPSQLLKYLRRISKKISSQYQSRRLPGSKADVKIDNTNRTQSGYLQTNSNSTRQNQNHRFRNTRCYNCSAFGHTAQMCLKPIKSCDKCKRFGHEVSQCLQFGFKPQPGPNGKDEEINKSDSKKVVQVIKEDNTHSSNGKYFKTIKLNGLEKSGYIDFGSQCTLIRQQVALDSNLTLDKSNLPTLKGFASGGILPLGRVSVNIEVDAVKADVEAYVVNDELLGTDVFIGQSLTELPSVTAHKTDLELILYCDDSKIDRVSVRSTEDVTFEGLQYIKVHTSDNYTGLLFVPGNVCMKMNNEFATLQGVYRFVDGIGQIIVVNFSGSPLVFNKCNILSRATKLPSRECFKCKTDSRNVESVMTLSESVQKETNIREPITLDMLNIGPKVNQQQQYQLLNLLNTYRNCFAFDMQELGLTNITEMAIRLNDDTPVSYKPYRLPYSERNVVRKIIGELLDNNVIRDSHSAYASPIVLVRKKNNDYRLCVDYRALNKKTIKDSYPMTVIDDQLDRLSDKKLFTNLDLASGYYQIPVAEASQHVTAFVTPDGHYEYTRMPFGLVNAPAVFQNMINKALGNRRFDLAIPYLDDLLSASCDFDDGFKKLEEILQLLSTAGLTLNLKKCFFFQSEIDYLGYEISESGLRPGAKKIQAVAEFPRPTNVHQIRQFIGLASFFRRFVYNFAALARPLTKLTKADVQWLWGPDQETAFQCIKDKLVTRPILALYDPNFETEVHCDASKVGIGGVLFQRENVETPLRPVAYFSRKTTREEEFWHSYELETMAVVFSLQKFRIYLLGLEFKVITDCSALRATLTKRDLLPKVARWWLILQEFNFTIEYRPGHSMQHVDALSRNPVLPANDHEELDILQISTSNWLHTVQMTDIRLKRIKTILGMSAEDLKDITKNYVLRDDKLYRRVGNKLKWVVPDGARWRICQINHDEAGHFSLEKTLEKISADYWFPKMTRFIKKYVGSCINCAYNKDMAGKRTGYLHPIPKVTTVFHTIHMDHLGPFIKSKRGNTYIIGVIDGFSKFIIIKAVRNTKSKTTIKVLEDIFAIVGCPKIIISDQGTSFTSGEFKNFVKSAGIKHVYNAVSTPRANGQIERYNRTILNSLASMNHDLDEKDWDINVPKVQWSLNNTLNKGIGKTPAEVVFGQRTNSPSDNVLKSALLDLTKDTSDIDEHTDIRKAVQETILNKQRKMKETFDNSRAPTKIFSEGDLVMIPNHNPEKGKSKKLAPKFRGPYKITAVLDRDRYEVSSIDGHSRRQYKNIYPADQLKSWVTFQLSPTGSNENTSESDSDESNNHSCRHK